MLLRAGADPAAPNADGTTALYAASVRGVAEIARRLLVDGASPDTESGHGAEGTPLCAAACSGAGPAGLKILFRNRRYAASAITGSPIIAVSGAPGLAARHGERKGVMMEDDKPMSLSSSRQRPAA
ncbi:hypothetical protein [Streptomyces sp. NPDC005181]|uniref:hypothetical protein n=1 Tax=Streptomyces sp. NPDC005181 TaxID=3156869 RepID=UPI0033B15591